MILNIALRELRFFFHSPLAWCVLAVIQALLAYLFLAQIETFLSIQARIATLSSAPGITDLVVLPLYNSAALILLLISPLLTMRLIAEEKRNKTIILLGSAPISNSEIILGKFLGIYAFFIILILLISLMPVSLMLGSNLDTGKLAANILGLLLLSAAFSSIGLYTSCLTRHPSIAAIISFGVLLLLWILDWSAGLSHQSSSQLEYFSLLSHFQNLQHGLINSKDICYYLLFCATFLMLSIRKLDQERLPQ